MFKIRHLLLVLVLASHSFSGKGYFVKFPLKISENKRYFTDSKGKPFLYLADTDWCLFFNLSKEEAVQLLEMKKAQGFNAIQVQLLPFGKIKDPINQQDYYGQKAFIDNDISKPNPEYFSHVKWVISRAEEMNLLIVCNSIWKSCCNDAYANILSSYPPEVWRKYGQFLGTTFQLCNNIIWFHGGDNDPGKQKKAFQQIAEGIKEIVPWQLQSYHASSSHSSTDVLNLTENKWLDYVMTYTYFPNKKGNWNPDQPHVYKHQHSEYIKTPVLPSFLGESLYEGEGKSEEEKANSSFIARRSAYWSIIGGGCGYAYGSKFWKVPGNWRDANLLPVGSKELSIMKNMFELLDWWNFVPDVNNTNIFEGQGTYGGDDFIISSSTSSKMIIYVPPTGLFNRTFSFTLPFYNNKIKMRWFNPVKGSYTKATYKSTEKMKFQVTTPGDNGRNQNDWILLIQK